jgi:tetratricopeptide (TPR) repeat protein
MAVDWVAVSKSIRLGTTGRAAEGLRLLIAHEATCESDRDRGAICGGKAMCYAHLGDFREAMAQIEAAREYAGTERDLMLQIDLSEAGNRMLAAEYQTACDLYEHIAVTYSDLLAEDRETAQEFDERYGYALVHVNRHEDAVRIFQQLLRSNRVEDEQRVRLYFGTALAACGHPRGAHAELELAAKGPDQKLAKEALARLSTFNRTQ